MKSFFIPTKYKTKIKSKLIVTGYEIQITNAVSKGKLSMPAVI